MTHSLSVVRQQQTTSRGHVLAPLIIDRADDTAWDAEADVVVVGFGGAGVVAALQAREGGADVLAVDRFGGGGATSYSGGVTYAGGTRHQAAVVARTRSHAPISRRNRGRSWCRRNWP